MKNKTNPTQKTKSQRKPSKQQIKETIKMYELPKKMINLEPLKNKKL